jgi:hypothetical protein
LRTEQVTGYLARDFIRSHLNADPAFLAHHVATIHRIPQGVGADWLINEMETLLKKATLRNRIYSISMACESGYMWRKYGGDHRGYCLEFANAGLFSLGGEVRYEDELTQFDLNDPDSFFIYRKTSKWREEQEARVVMYPRVPEFLQFFKNGESPFAWFEPTLLQRIILGAKMTMPNREQIRACALERCPQLLVTESQVAGVAV